MTRDGAFLLIINIIEEKPFYHLLTPRDIQGYNDTDSYRSRRMRNAVGERDKWICHKCNKRVDRTKVWPHAFAPVVDHYPIARCNGGRFALDNLKLAHSLCNGSSSMRDISKGFLPMQFEIRRYDDVYYLVDPVSGTVYAKNEDKEVVEDRKEELECRQLLMDWADKI
jgi:hypothetical protein